MMTDNLYSTTFEVYEGELSAAVLSAIDEIKAFFSIDKVRPLKTDEFHIAIPVIFKVSLPPMGAVGGVDIREEEPCLVKISLAGYPYDSPLVISDRKDFPRKFLGHMYVSRDENLQGAFCLVRNDLHEWFADKTIFDVLTVAKEWLFKAGAGLLNSDAGEFDPLRLENYRSYHIYKYDMIRDIVANNLRLLPEHPFALLLTCYYKDREEVFYMSITPIVFVQLQNLKSFIQKLTEGEDSEVLALISLVVWREDGAIEEEYCTELPKTFESLVSYFNAMGIDIKSVLSIYLRSDLRYTLRIPVIHAIRRPKTIIGHDGVYEFINFVVDAKDFTTKKLVDDAEVWNQSHIEPFSSEMACKLTGEARNAKMLFVGGGSLGSKMYLHEARSGNITLGLSDHEDLLQHNLARHALYNPHAGRNKAQALVKESKAFFLLNKTSDLKSFPYRVHKIDEEPLHFYDWIVDTTAGTSVLNWLTSKDFKKGITVARCEMAHRGQLGLLYIEGEGRNPRIDDLVNLTYFLATKNKFLQEWRLYDAETERLNLSVGLGCSSTTTVSSDDSISFHASIFSKVLYKEKNREWSKSQGLLFRSILNEKDGLPEARSEFDIVSPFEIYACNNNSGWEIRFMHGMTKKFLNLCKAKDVETGGVLIGVANYKTKVIHVFDLIAEPKGSKGTCIGFTRGIEGLPEQVNEIKKQTGQVIGYVGEWHTHPMNLERLSTTDHETIAKLQVKNRRVPIPTLGVIVTNTKLLPFVFE